MDMIELKRVDKSKEKETALCCSDWPNDEYPVAMYIENDQLGQLGIKTLEVGQEMTITCKVRVTSFSSNETDQGSYRSARLSVMAMAVGEEAPKLSAAQVMYGAKDDK